MIFFAPTYGQGYERNGPARGSDHERERAYARLQMATTVIRASAIWTGGADPKMIYDHDLVIENGVVAGIVQDHKGSYDHEVDASGCVVIPGLINCHTHAGCTPHARGISEDLTFTRKVHSTTA